MKSRRNPRTPLGVVSPRGRSSSEPQSPPGQKAQKFRMLHPEADKDRGRLRRPPKERSPRRQLRDRRPVPRQQPCFVITKRTEVPSFFLSSVRLSRGSPKADPSEDSQPTQALQNPGHHVTTAMPEIPPLRARASGNAHLPGGHWNSADALGRDL